MPGQSKKSGSEQRIKELEKQIEKLSRELDEARLEQETTGRRLELAIAILDNIPHFATVKDRDGKYLMVNRAAQKIIGKSSEDIVGKSPHDLYPANIADKIHQDDMEVIRRGQGLTTEEILRLDDDRHYFTTKVPLYSNDGEPEGLIGMAADITELKDAQRMLAKREAELSAVFNNAAVGIVVSSTSGTILRVNKHSLTLFGYDNEEELLGRKTDAVTHPDDLDRLLKARDELVSRESSFVHMEKKYLRKDGSFFWGEVFVAPIKGSEGEEQRHVSMIINIDRRMAAHQALEYRVRHERLVSEISSAMINLNIDALDDALNGVLQTIGEFASVDRSYVFMFNFDKPTMDNTHEWCRDGIEPQIDRLKDIPLADFRWAVEHVLQNKMMCIESLDDLPVEAEMEKKEFELEGIKSLMIVPLTSGGKMIGFLGFDAVEKERAWPDDVVALLKLVGDTIANALERKRAESALRESEEKFRELAEMLPVTIFETDLDGRILFVNRSGLEDLEINTDDFASHITIYDFTPPEEISKVRDDLKRLGQGKDVRLRQINIRRKDGSLFPALVQANAVMQDGKSIGTRGFFVDITERIQLEEERRRSSNLESVGLLAGGIAHDFNNILASIIGYINMAQIVGEDGGNFQEYLESAESATVRAKDLTQQLLTFSKGGVPVRTAVSVPQLIDNSADIALIGSNVRCELAIDDNLWPADIDEGQISQVLNNILINAKQAMSGGGVIRITAKNINLRKTTPSLPVKKGRYIKISVSDQGVGIPAEEISKIFEPYYTTKAGGSGLGLATSYSIIRKHEGYLDVVSEESKGTTMHIYLPASDTEAAVVGGSEPKKSYAVGRILLMDDEQDLLDVVTKMLEFNGNQVETALDGEEALAKYKAGLNNGTPFDAVVMDLTIPGGMGGKEAVGKMLELDPDAKVVVSSGYSEDSVMANYKEYGFKAAIAKPYSHNDIVQVISDVLTG